MHTCTDRTLVIISALLLALSIVLACAFGATAPTRTVFLYVRLPRVLASLIAGSALALSGFLIQTVLGNSLASPNIIGVNAGAGFAATLCYIAFPAFVPFASFLGALGATLLIAFLATKTGMSKTTIILSGVAINSIFNAGSNTLSSLFPNSLFNSSAFRIGGLSGVMLSSLTIPGLLVLLAIILSFCGSRNLEILALGDENARSIGLDIRFWRLFFLTIASLLAGSAVSFAGLLGFVGLVVPHVVRMLSSRRSFPVMMVLNLLFGATFTILCDLLSRLLFAPYEIPVGIIISFIGGPFFLYLLFKKKGGHHA